MFVVPFNSSNYLRLSKLVDEHEEKMDRVYQVSAIRRS
jgi:hypothetical protein